MNKQLSDYLYYHEDSPDISVYCGDALEIMKLLPDKLIDLVCTDPPYAETGNKWDTYLDFQALFEELERVISESGAIVMTSTVRLASKIIPMVDYLYKYDWVWVKDNGTNAPNTPYQPFRIHELVLVFGKGRVTNGTRTPMKYNPQKTSGEPYKQMAGKMSKNWKGGLKQVETDNATGDRHPLTVQKWNRDKGLHPTQKPLEMFEYFVKTYTDENDTILDPFLGSGTTLIACKELDRRGIGIEISEEYCKIAVNRLKNTMRQFQFEGDKDDKTPLLCDKKT